MAFKLPRFKLPALFNRPARVRHPDPRSLGRTGDAKYVPQISRWGASRNGSGKVVCLANRYDSISVRDYDRVRMYPVCRDGLSVIRTPVTRANFHFTCARQVIADAAMQELGPKMRALIDQLVRGAMEFGNQACEKVWVPNFDVTVTSTQSDTGSTAEREFPFLWTIKRFNSFDPQDTRLLVYDTTGEFAGVRQFVGDVRKRDIPDSKLVHFVNDREYDSNYGMPRTKAAVPFVEIAESVYDDMAVYSRTFAVPWKVGHHRPGFTGSAPDGEGNVVPIPNAALMDDFLAALESGHSASIPSEFDRLSGNPYWELEVLQAQGEDRYIEKLAHLNEMIRMALVVLEMASSNTPDSGTYNLGEVQLDLFLANLESILDQLAEVINEQLLQDFVLFNFGADAPPCKIIFEPLDVKVKRALLQALINMLGTDVPLEDGDGNQLQVDWAKMAQDAGVALNKVNLRDRASKLRQAAEERLKALAPAPSEGGDQTAEKDDDKDAIADLSEGAKPLAEGIPTWVTPEEISVYPELQYRPGVDVATGCIPTVDLGMEGEPYDVDRGGVLLCWRGPDGQLYVVDGHHRLARAKNSPQFVSSSAGDEPQPVQRLLPVRIIEASAGWTIDAAREQGRKANGGQ